MTPFAHYQPPLIQLQLQLQQDQKQCKEGKDACVSSAESPRLTGVMDSAHHSNTSLLSSS